LNSLAVKIHFLVSIATAIFKIVLKRNGKKGFNSEYNPYLAQAQYYMVLEELLNIKL